MQRRAFTLIELLAVIAIVVQLIALLFPALRAARNRAVRQVCRRQMRAIRTGIPCYYDDHKKWRPDAGPGVYS